MAAHPLTDIVNAITEAHIHTPSHSESESYPNTACTVEGIFYYFR